MFVPPIPYKRTFEFCECTVFEDYIYIVINEGETIHVEYQDILLEFANTFFPNKPFVYISHRKKIYTVDPLIYKNLVGFVIINEIQIPKKQLDFELNLLTTPNYIAKTLRDALVWKNKILAESTL